MTQRIPSSEFQYHTFEDQDIISAYNWFRSFVSERGWSERKKKIEEDISIVFNDRPQFIDIRKGVLIAIQKDQIGWYLYLIYTAIHEPYKYDYTQGARIMPIFKRIGMNLDLVEKIGGIKKKVKDLLKKRTSDGKNGGSCYSQNGDAVTVLMWQS